jgi:N4-gp56 family major capsid protein
MQGQATQLPGGATVVLTGTGVAQTPPAAPATGVTVYPTFVIGRGSYGQVKLDDVKTTWLDKADKSDPLNQERVIGWKCMYGSIILNSQFAARIESSSAFSATFG